MSPGIDEPFLNQIVAGDVKQQVKIIEITIDK